MGDGRVIRVVVGWMWRLWGGGVVGGGLTGEVNLPGLNLILSLKFDLDNLFNKESFSDTFKSF